MHSSLFAIVSSQARVATLVSDVELIEKPSMQPQEQEEFFLCVLALQITVETDTQDAVQVWTRGLGIVFIETHYHLAECHCSIVTRDVLETISDKKFYIYFWEFRGTLSTYQNTCLLHTQQALPNTLDIFEAARPRTQQSPEQELPVISWCKARLNSMWKRHHWEAIISVYWNAQKNCDSQNFTQSSKKMFLAYGRWKRARAGKHSALYHAGREKVTITRAQNPGTRCKSSRHWLAGIAKTFGWLCHVLCCFFRNSFEL